MRLFHGTNEAFETIDLAKGRRFKDFGQGFYTTLIEEQAYQWAETMMRRYNSKNGFVLTFEYDEEQSGKLTVLRFKQPSEDWAYFIMNNRGSYPLDERNILNNRENQYDIVEGPVANDNIAVVLDQFLMNMKSGTALVEALEYKNLSHQLSFHTIAALQTLTKVGSYAI